MKGTPVITEYEATVGFFSSILRWEASSLVVFFLYGRGLVHALAYIESK